MLNITVNPKNKEVATKYNGKRDIIGKLKKSRASVLTIECICGETHKTREAGYPFIGKFNNIKEIRESVKYQYGHLRRIEETETEENKE